MRTAYETGRGKIMIKSRTHFEEEKNKLALIITEIPYEVNKAQLVRKIDEIRIDKKIDGMIEVRDESDREGLRIAIDLKKDANRELVLNYLLKNTDLQISYNFNMIAIDHRRPRQLGLLDILDAYIAHQREVVTKSKEFDLAHAKDQLHIVEGLIKCLSILDEVIQTIRGSKNKQDAQANLIREYDFTPRQADAILSLQLYKLTNTDVTALEEELSKLRIIVARLEEILGDEAKLKAVMKEELRLIKKEYALPRLTDIKEEITEIKIDTSVMIPKEDVIVVVTKDGYVKRTSYRSYTSSSDEMSLKTGDYILGYYEMNTQDTLLLFTNYGNFLYVPVHELPDLKWKEQGKHISNLIKLEEGEEVIASYPVHQFEQDLDFTMVSRNGMIKRTKLMDFKVSRYSKPVVCMKLKADDRLVAVYPTLSKDLFIVTKHGYSLWFDCDEVPIVGLKTSGVKGINLKDDVVVSSMNFNAKTEEYVAVITDKGTGKRVRLTEFEKSSRARRGLLVLREVKTNPYLVLRAFITESKHRFGLKGTDVEFYKLTELPIADRYSTGSTITKSYLEDAFLEATLQKEATEVIQSEEETPKKEEEPKKKVSLKEIDERLMTIDDFLDF